MITDYYIKHFSLSTFLVCRLPNIVRATEDSTTCVYDLVQSGDYNHVVDLHRFHECGGCVVIRACFRFRERERERELEREMHTLWVKNTGAGY